MGGMKMASYQKTHMKNKNYKLYELNQLAEVRYHLLYGGGKGLHQGY